MGATSATDLSADVPSATETEAGNAAARLADVLVLPYLNHAVSMYEAGYASREGIDNGMIFGCGLPVGPLARVDALGLTSVRDELAAVHAASGDPLHAPRPLLDQLIDEGRSGREAGAGFYTYAAPGADEVVADDLTPSGGVPEGVELRNVATVGVVGTGTMASGIAEVFAKAGWPVTVVGRSTDKVEAVTARIGTSLAKAVQRGRTTQEEADAVLARLTLATSREALADVDLVVEAIAEELSVKQELFRDLDRITAPGTILATTTSSLPIAELAAVTTRAQDVVGMHFFNPAPVMKLVEIVRTDETAADVLATVADLCRRTNKVAVSCSDRSGFIVNALLFPYLNDAVKLVESGAATIDEVDAAITEHHGYPMGPFALLDVVGLDVSLAIQRELLAEFGHEGFTPARMLVDLVAAGHLGRKTGRGFRDHG
ncbi:3-hydroxyacyl-CoA dehydrogenase NAD-binding domain-containing protein [Janibacter sp. G1551]|uniref:3-hydroxyacyl-CoA dehydrogenase family protein n=1 Tax=Janibacter sp. G1551 TaxID=3420440 RepID=UPI003D05FC17